MGGTLFIVFLTFVHVSLLLNSIIAVNPKKGFSIKMIHIDSKESPLYPGDHLTQYERLQRLVEQSQARYVKSKVLPQSNAKRSMNPDIARLLVTYEANMYYVAMVGIGTFAAAQPFMRYYLMIDSGSDDTWLQCQGANNSFNQDSRYPLYPHDSSSTFELARCMDNHPNCGRTKCTPDGLCPYTATYLDGSVTSGLIAKEKFTLDSHTAGVLEEIYLYFGCGLNQVNFGSFFGNNRRQLGRPDVIAGILGLGPGPGSFLNQLGEDGQFVSYCFQLFDLNIAAPSTYLRFGEDAAFGENQQVLTTPIVEFTLVKQLYYLILEGISVGGIEAKFRKGAFEINDRGEGGAAIDSGSPVSVMYKDHFDRVARLVKRHLNGIPYITYVGRARAFDICFRVQPGFDTSNYPSIALQFQQARYVISDYRANFVMVPDGQQDQLVCLGILRATDRNAPDFLLGALQQANKRIRYEIVNEALSFATENCA